MFKNDRKTGAILDHLMIRFDNKTIADTFIDILEKKDITFNRCILKAQIYVRRF